MTRPAGFVFSPEVRAYHVALGDVAEALLRKYLLDDMGQATPAMLDELATRSAEVDARFGVSKH